jgi:hypothetical protein
MQGFKKIILAGAIVLATGCASGLNSVQEREYNAMAADGVLIEEKNPTAGAWLGVLPGGGSFYARHYGYGVANLLLWPLSIVWDPMSGYDGAKVINYDVTKHSLKKAEQKEEDLLNDELALGRIDEKKYILGKHKIESKYDY